MAAISENLRHDLAQLEFSEGYAESFQDTYIATQLKVLREQNRWTQATLAEKLGTTQTVISRIENVNYSAWNISTLKKLARAFRVRLKVSFETYGSLINDVENFSRKSLQRAPREEDPDLAACAESLPGALDKSVSARSVAAGATVIETERIATTIRRSRQRVTTNSPPENSALGAASDEDAPPQRKPPLGSVLLVQAAGASACECL